MIEQIGRYKVVRELGRGGFGHVYLAYDPVMDRQVAVKVLTELDDPSMIARFRTEAIAAGNLHHRNIVTIYDFGEDRQQHYLVMEFLDGRDLQRLMAAKDQPLALWQKVDIMSQIAEGLYCAHQSGVVHRDVKPANVIVLRDGTVKILDFGIARLTERDDTRVTKTGFLVGTVLYMAPEQLSDGAVDALSDIWSYGIIYYEILTGRHPFAAQSNESLMYRIMNQDPERVRSLVPDCPESLERIVLRLLAKQRENRYQSLAEVQYDTLPLLRELKRQQATGLLVQAAGLVDGGRYAEAQPIILSILDLDPGNAEGVRLRERIAQALRRQTVKPKIDKLLETVETQAAARNYQGALQALEKARSLDPSDASLTQRMEALRARQQQSEMAQRCILEARHHLELQNLTEAFKQATSAVNADPTAPDAAELLDKVQREMGQRDRERNVQRAINRAKGLLVMEVFDEAVELLRKAAEDYPGTERIEELLRQTLRQKAEKEAREKVASAVAAARNLIKKRSFAEAIAMLEAIHREFPADSELAGLLGFARDELAADERAAALERLIRQARALAQNRDFDAAVHVIEEGLGVYSGDESLLRLLQAVLAAKAEDERSRSLQEGLARCRRLREQGAIPEALELCSALQHDHPGAVDVARLREELLRDQGQIEERRLGAEREAAAQRESAALIAEAARRADNRDWTGALKIVEDGMRRYPAVTKLNEVADYMRRKKSEADSLLAIESACADIQRSLEAGQLEAAGEGLARARRDCPPDPRFDALDAQLQKAVFRQEHFRTAQEKIRDRALPEAERELQAILEHDPQDASARNLLNNVVRQRTAEERKLKYDAGRAEASRLLRERQFDAAVRTLESLLADFPGDPLLQEELRIAREARERTARGETVARGRTAADELLRNKNFAKAIWLLEELQKRFPEEFAVGEDLKAARAAKEDYDRKQSYAAGRAEAERLLAARDFAGAIAQYQALEQQFPNDPFLPDARKAAIAAQEEYQRTKEAAEGRAEAQRLLRDRIPEAIVLLRKLVQRFPEDVALAELLRAALATQRNRALIAGRAEAEKLAAERSYEAAIRRYEDLLKEYPGDQVLMEGLAAVKTAQAADEWKQGYARGRGEAERLVAARSYDAAVERYRTLLQQYPRDAALEEGLAAAAAARDAAERKQVYALGRKAVDDALRGKNFAEAIQLLQGLQKRFPEEPAIPEDLKTVVALKQEYDGKQAYREGRAEAERLLAARDFQGAVAKYQSLLQQFPNDPFLPDALKAAIAAGEQYQRRKEAALGRGEAERLMRERKASEAIALLQTLVQKFPEDIGLADDLRAAIDARDQSLRTQALTAGRTAVERLAAERSYEAAIRRYEDLLKEYPGDRALMEGLAAVKAARVAEQRRQAYDRGRAEAERLAAARSHDAAIKRYRELLEEYPRDAALEEGLAAAAAAKDAAERKQIYDQGRAEAERLERELKFDAALRRLDELLGQFPNDPALEEYRESLAAAQKSRDERLRIDKQMAQLEKLYRKGDAQGVKEGATGLLVQADTPRLRELIKWADGVLKQQAEPIPAPDNRAPRGRKQWLVVAAAALPVAIVALAGFLYWNAHRRPAGSVTVTADQISFVWEKGTAVPGPKKLTVISDGAWTLSKSDDWVVAQRVPDDQGSVVAVSIAPDRLAPGMYSGLLTIAGTGASRNVHVKVTVQEPPKPVETARAEPVETPQPKTPSKADAKSTPPAPPKVVAPADPPVTDQAVDCKASTWFGVDHGRLGWSGELPPGGYVLLGRTLKSVGGAAGTWTGEALPGCEVTITKGTSAAETAVDPPAAANKFSRLRVRNVSSTPLSSFSLTWDIK